MSSNLLTCIFNCFFFSSLAIHGVSVFWEISTNVWPWRIVLQGCICSYVEFSTSACDTYLHIPLVMYLDGYLCKGVLQWMADQGARLSKPIHWNSNHSKESVLPCHLLTLHVFIMLLTSSSRIWERFCDAYLLHIKFQKIRSEKYICRRFNERAISKSVNRIQGNNQAIS
jgi:hypothetical protein